MESNNQSKRYKKIKKQQNIILQESKKSNLRPFQKLIIIISLFLLCIGAIILIVYLSIN